MLSDRRVSTSSCSEGERYYDSITFRPKPRSMAWPKTTCIHACTPLMISGRSFRHGLASCQSIRGARWRRLRHCRLERMRAKARFEAASEEFGALLFDTFKRGALGVWRGRLSNFQTRGSKIVVPDNFLREDVLENHASPKVSNEAELRADILWNCPIDHADCKLHDHEVQFQR